MSGVKEVNEEAGVNCDEQALVASRQFSWRSQTQDEEGSTCREVFLSREKGSRIEKLSFSDITRYSAYIEKIHEWRNIVMNFNYDNTRNETGQKLENVHKEKIGGKTAETLKNIKSSCILFLESKGNLRRYYCKPAAAGTQHYFDMWSNYQRIDS